ncbi:MAG TPA: dihydrolipoamide acetyltransferase, partial [Accumulibacter sp.]|uniref:biotin/lipoyl-containing protein n=1 Tax=Accumulibacter sp. TaxID=2053492 RepID=UPI002C3118E2
MSQLIEVKVPDIGDFHDVPVIDICVQVGDAVKVDDALVTLESDKATMDVPSSAAGVVKEVRVQLGDKVSEGSVVVILAAGADAGVKPAGAPAPAARRTTPGRPWSRATRAK